MTCKFCGGYVEWKGPLVALTHTECSGCGCVNCQEIEDDEPEGAEVSDDEPIHSAGSTW